MNKIIELLKKRKDTPKVKNEKDDIEMFEKYIEQAKIIITDSSVNENDLHPIFSYIKQLTDIITLESALNSYNNQNSHAPFILKQVIEGRYSNFSKEKLTRIIMKLPNEEDLIYYKQAEYKLFICDLTMELANEPIVLNPWNSNRISNAIMNIAVNKNEFDREKGRYNLMNNYYFPVGIAICNGGNHSQYSAQIKGKGITNIDEVINMEELYENIKFDGRCFHYNYPNTDFDIYPQEIYPKNRIEFYGGILFEVGRLLKENLELFPEGIRKVISECSSL